MKKLAVTVLSLYFYHLLAMGCGQNLTAMEIYPDDCANSTSIRITVSSLTPVSLTGTAPFNLIYEQNYTVTFEFTPTTTPAPLPTNATLKGNFLLTGTQNVSLTVLGILVRALGGLLPAVPMLVPGSTTFPLVAKPSETVLTEGVTQTVVIVFNLPTNVSNLLLSPNIFVPTFYSIGPLILTAEFTDLNGNVAWCKKGQTQLVNVG